MPSTDKRLFQPLTQPQRVAQRRRAIAIMQSKVMAAAGKPAAKLRPGTLSQLAGQYPGQPLKQPRISPAVLAQMYAKQMPNNLHQANALAAQQQAMSSHLNQASAAQQQAIMQAMYNGNRQTSNGWTSTNSTTATGGYSLSIPIPTTQSAASFAVGNATAQSSTYTVATIPRALYEDATIAGFSGYEIGELIRETLLNGYTIQDGHRATLTWPDGAKLRVKHNGSWSIDDKDAKVIYRANRVRDFNRHFNAAERMEEFIAYCGTFGITKAEMLDLPVSLFISWLVLQAAKADDEPDPPEAKTLIPDLRARAEPVCRGCGAALTPEHPV